MEFNGHPSTYMGLLLNGQPHCAYCQQVRLFPPIHLLPVLRLFKSSSVGGGPHIGFSLLLPANSFRDGGPRP
jgi:hypothetical protein